MSNNVTSLPVQALDTRYTQDVIPILDTSKFEHMQRIATAMVACSTIPESIRGIRKGETLLEFPQQTVVANCFRIVNQAVRWGMDPFAVMDCASIVHGKLMWEGKLVAAVIDAKLGVKLNYDFDDKPGQDLGVRVHATLPGELKPREITGRVKDWHKGAKSPWGNEGAWRRQLRYMGAREWARAHVPAVMLGVYADDELGEIASRDVPAGQRAQRMKDITPPKPASQPAADLPDIPDEAPKADETAEAKAAIESSISLEMLAHVREAFSDVDWDQLEPIFDARMALLEAKAHEAAA
jgi:hypothetical protein